MKKKKSSQEPCLYQCVSQKLVLITMDYSWMGLLCVLRCDIVIILNLSLFFFLKVAIPERCLPSELGWPTGPQKPVFSLKEEQALVRKLTFSSDMAEGKRY